MPRPPVQEDKALTWPHWPMKLRTSSSQEEGAEREFAVITTGFKGENGRVRALRCERDGRPFELEADLVLLAMGFLGPRADGVVAEAEVALTPRGARSEEHTSELQSLMRISFAVFCLKKKKQKYV